MYPLVEIANLKNNKLELSKIAISMVFDKNCIIEHPNINKLATYPRTSKRIGMTNVIHFSDQNLENHWYLIQLTSFIDGYLSENNFVNYRNMPGVEAAKKSIESKVTLFDLNIHRFGFDGFIFSQTRPYHYFYDQLVNYYSLSELKNIDEYCFKDQTCFYDEIGTVKFKQAKDTGCYLFPTLIPGDYSSTNAKMMHDFLRKNSASRKSSSDINLWFGITGQKRSWLEQVEACVELCKNINKNYAKVTIFIDGWTAYTSETIENKEDQLVFNSIKKQLDSFEDIELVNLIGLNFKDKISYGNIIDFYIANSGSGSIVPHAVCQKKGVIHGRLKTFERIYDQNVLSVPLNKMKLEDSGTVMNDSYSFHWSVVYNLLINLGLRGNKVEEVLTNIPSKIEFSRISVTDKHQPADILRDIAVKFEKCGDIETALKLMEKAKEQRPNGPFIKSKVEEYSKLLASEIG